MKLYSLKIKDAVFKVALVDTEESMKQGLSGSPKLAEGKGVLFNFKESQTVTMNMGGMHYPLDMVFIGKDRKVIAIRSMRVGDVDTTCKECVYVLEINKGEGKGLEGEKVQFTKELAESLGFTIGEKGAAVEEPIKQEEAREEKDEDGSSVNIIITIDAAKEKVSAAFKQGGAFKIYEEDVRADPRAMQVLDDTGKILINIKGGERIFSITHTEELIELARKVDIGEADEEELGKLMAEIIDIQNKQDPEYV